MNYREWTNRYKSTIDSVLGEENYFPINENDLKVFLLNNQSPEWSALLELQEKVTSFTYDEWKKFVDQALISIINKGSHDVNDLPYYDLWDKNNNPLIIAMYALFNSNEDLENTNLRSDAADVWFESSTYYRIKKQIDFILYRW